MHFSSLGPVPCVFTSWASSGLTIGSGCRLMAGILSFLSSLRAHVLTLEGCNCWSLWHPFYWYGRKYSISQKLSLDYCMCLCSVTLVMSGSFATSWTVVHQAPLSMDFPGRNTGVDCHFLLQGIFLTQGSYLCFLHWQVDSLPLSHEGSPQLITYPSCILSSGNIKIKEALSLSSRSL